MYFVQSSFLAVLDFLVRLLDHRRGRGLGHSRGFALQRGPRRWFPWRPGGRGFDCGGLGGGRSLSVGRRSRGLVRQVSRNLDRGDVGVLRVLLDQSRAARRAVLDLVVVLGARGGLGLLGAVDRARLLRGRVAVRGDLGLLVDDALGGLFLVMAARDLGLVARLARNLRLRAGLAARSVGRRMTSFCTWRPSRRRRRSRRGSGGP